MPVHRKILINVDEYGRWAMIKYFAYGSNMDKDDLDKWCNIRKEPLVRIYSAVPAVLKGYKLEFNYYSISREAGAANIMVSENNNVYGLLLEIDETGQETIRKKEGCPCYYDETTVNVEELDEKTIKDVTTYKVRREREIAEFQKPSKKYMDLIIKNAKKYNFPIEYIQYLESIPVESSVV